MAQAHKAKTMMTMMASSVFTRLSSDGMTTEQLLCNITTDPENFSIKSPSSASPIQDFKRLITIQSYPVLLVVVEPVVLVEVVVHADPELGLEMAD